MMTQLNVKLNNDIELESDLIRVTIMEGDILINGIKDLPKRVLLYYRGNVIISGEGVIKYG